MPENPLNRTRAAIVAGKGLLARFSDNYFYPVSEGEILFATDAKQFAVARGISTAGDVGRIPTGQAIVSLANQTAGITTTALHTPGANGLFRIAYYVAVTTTDATGTLTLTLGWTDEVGARTLDAIAGLSLASTTYAQGQIVVWALTSAPITYAVSLAGLSGSPAYSIRLAVERIF